VERNEEDRTQLLKRHYPETDIMKLQGTETAEGFIPHLEVMYDGGMIIAPVKLAVRPQQSVRGKGIVYKHTMTGNLPTPMRIGSGLVFALPGGLEMIK
jgi:hypothetical protein